MKHTREEIIDFILGDLKMRLFHLQQIDECGYDEFDAKLIRAKDEKEARIIANEHTADEGQIWGDSKLVSCVPVNQNGEAGVILESFNAG